MNIEEAKKVLNKLAIYGNEVGDVPVVQIHHIKNLLDQIKLDQPQIDGLTKQLTRTQYQLKKVSEESANKTDRIAELTNNGG